MSEPRTLFQKIWDAHVVHAMPGGPALLYVDLHLVHEVTSPQAFEGLRLAGRRVRRPERTLATVDHNVPTGDRHLPIADPIAAQQVRTLTGNARAFGLPLFDLDSPDQGIVHVIGPELGATQPGMTIVCGDSHTSTHGAFGALAFGIGTSEVEHVLATQCLMQQRPRTMEVRFEGMLPIGVTAKDMILALIGRIGTDGASGHVLEYRGSAVRAVVDGRPDDHLQHVDRGRRARRADRSRRHHLRVPRGSGARADGRRRGTPRSSAGVASSPIPEHGFDRTITIDVSSLAPQVTWGTNPGMVADITGRIPVPGDGDSADARGALERALHYMGLEPGESLQGLKVDRVFLGSCTNARLEDLRAAASVVRGRKVARGVRALVVPGSQRVKSAAEAEGLDEVFIRAGFEWRNSGCSMCLGMNDDVLGSGERCASTSNRNFEGTTGQGGPHTPHEPGHGGGGGDRGTAR